MIEIVDTGYQMLNNGLTWYPSSSIRYDVLLKNNEDPTPQTN